MFNKIILLFIFAFSFSFSVVSAQDQELKTVSSVDFNGANVKLITITGQTLIQTIINSGNNHSINMSAYAPGLYFIEVNQNGEVSRMKVMKN